MEKSEYQARIDSDKTSLTDFLNDVQTEVTSLKSDVEGVLYYKNTTKQTIIIQRLEDLDVEFE